MHSTEIAGSVDSTVPHWRYGADSRGDVRDVNIFCVSNNGITFRCLGSIQRMASGAWHCTLATRPARTWTAPSRELARQEVEALVEAALVDPERRAELLALW